MLNNTLICIGYMSVDFSKKMMIEDYEEGFFVLVNENTDDINEHLCLMYKSRHLGCSIMCSVGTPFTSKRQLICPVIFKNITSDY